MSIKPISIFVLAASVVLGCTDRPQAGTATARPGQQPPDREQPVKWSIAPVTAAFAVGKTVPVRIDVSLQRGWHIYAVTQPAAGPTGGPLPTRISMPPEQPFVMAGDPVPTSKPEIKFDEAFRMDVQEHDQNVAFAVPVRATTLPSSTDSVRVNVRYQVCNARLCYPPQTVRLATPAQRGSE